MSNMKVKDLIEELKKYDPEKECVVYGAYGSMGDIVDVEETEESQVGGETVVGIISDIMSG